MAALEGLLRRGTTRPLRFNGKSKDGCGSGGAIGDWGTGDDSKTTVEVSSDAGRGVFLRGRRTIGVESSDGCVFGGFNGGGSGRLACSSSVAASPKSKNSCWSFQVL